MDLSCFSINLSSLCFCTNGCLVCYVFPVFFCLIVGLFSPSLKCVLYISITRSLLPIIFSSRPLASFLLIFVSMSTVGCYSSVVLLGSTVSIAVDYGFYIFPENLNLLFSSLHIFEFILNAIFICL